MLPEEAALNDAMNWRVGWSHTDTSVKLPSTGSQGQP